LVTKKKGRDSIKLVLTAGRLVARFVSMAR
jgi:hypothetical protein